MVPGSEFLSNYPALASVVDLLSRYLEDRHPKYFGTAPSHPCLPIKRSKVVHDNLWGTIRFSWQELTLMDSPLMQRLRDIHQTGLAYHIYPSARHSRFEHSLGTTIIASRIYDALLHKQRDVLRTIATRIEPDPDIKSDTTILRFKQELRLAALLHDTGHSLFSHTSERVYRQLAPLADASRELSAFVGKEKGAGEVLSFCFALTPAIDRLLDRAGENLIGDQASDDYSGRIDMTNVALIIVGQAAHPFLKFLGDIISSGFDADKLDYLLRDARAAGLPLNYDIDRYYYDVHLQKERIADGEGNLEKLFSRLGKKAPSRKEDKDVSRYEYYETYRLKLSRRAINVIEQIVICKMMLFSYIYHHGKVRAAEGLLERLLQRKLVNWRDQGEPDADIIYHFIDMTDAALYHMPATKKSDPIADDCAYRLVNRLLPREVYSIGATSSTHADGELVKDFMLHIHEREVRDQLITDLETAIGEELVKAQPDLGPDIADALANAGVWVDAPKPPNFEDVDAMIKKQVDAQSGVAIEKIFPIGKWIEAYQHYRYQVRVFSYSEHWNLTRDAAKAAMKRVLRIYDDKFYDSIRRDRG